MNLYVADAKFSDGSARRLTSAVAEEVEQLSDRAKRQLGIVKVQRYRAQKASSRRRIA